MGWAALAVVLAAYVGLASATPAQNYEKSLRKLNKYNFDLLPANYDNKAVENIVVGQVKPEITRYMGRFAGKVYRLKARGDRTEYNNAHRSLRQILTNLESNKTPFAADIGISMKAAVDIGRVISATALGYDESSAEFASVFRGLVNKCVEMYEAIRGSIALDAPDLYAATFGDVAGVSGHGAGTSGHGCGASGSGAGHEHGGHHRDSQSG